LLLLPKGIFSLENVQINDKCDDTGQTQGFSGRLHAIVRNFVLDLVSFLFSFLAYYNFKLFSIVIIGIHFNISYKRFTTFF